MKYNKKIKALTLDDYEAGKGGTITPGIYLVITLSDGSSVTADEMYKYIFDNVDGDIKRIDYTMETDYYINVNGKNQLLFTRDYGNNCFSFGIPSKKGIACKNRTEIFRVCKRRGGKSGYQRSSRNSRKTFTG